MEPVAVWAARMEAQGLTAMKQLVDELAANGMAWKGGSGGYMRVMAIAAQKLSSREYCSLYYHCGVLEAQRCYNLDPMKGKDYLRPGTELSFVDEAVDALSVYMDESTPVSIALPRRELPRLAGRIAGMAYLLEHRGHKNMLEQTELRLPKNMKFRKVLAELIARAKEECHD